MPANIPTANSEFLIDALRQSPVMKNVYALVTAATGIAIWTPATGKKFRIKGIALKPSITTTLGASALAGHQVVLYDGALSATSVFFPVATVNAATQAAGSWLGTAGDLEVTAFLNEGYVSAAANNAVNLGLVNATPALVSPAAGVILVTGIVFGEEV